MTPNARQIDLLRSLQAGPRTMRYFSHGFQRVAPSVTENDFAKLMKAGYVSETAETYFITPDGENALSDADARQPAPSRAYCNASMTAPYTPSAWNVRAGAERHKEFSSKGLRV